MKLKRIGVVKGAFFMGLYGIVIGLISAILAFILTSFLSSVMDSIGGGTVSSFSMWSFIYFPFGYGVLSLIGGFIFIPLANLILKLLKGIDLELGEDDVKPVENKSSQQTQKPVEVKKPVALPKINEIK